MAQVVAQQGELLRHALAALTQAPAARPDGELAALKAAIEKLGRQLEHGVPGVRRVDVDLQIAEDRVSLEVADNGVGIAEADLNGKKSLGLLGMHERALLFGGEVSITGRPGEGTRVLGTIPLRKN